MTDPVLSIITPLYNRAWCIADCIGSVGLGDLPVEMVIVDDGSTDGSIERAEEAIARLGIADRVTLIRQVNAGPSAARNRAAAAARGLWLVFLDSDDLWLPWTLQAVFTALSDAPAGANLAFLKGQNFSDRSELDDVEPEALRTESYNCFVDAVKANPASRYGACNAAVQRDAFLQLGGFAPELRCAEDTDLFLRVTGRVMLLRAPVLAALRRSGHESLTGNISEVFKGFRWMLEKNGTGYYVGEDHDRRSFLAGSCVYSIRAAFAAGYPLQAYALWFRHLGLLTAARTRKYLFRLPLTPLLHLRKPVAYPFRLRPARR